MERTVTICNQRGLHARASAKFVAEVANHQAEIRVARDSEEVSADSIMDLLMLAAGPGTQITIKAAGPDAEQALDALSTLVESKFHESE